MRAVRALCQPLCWLVITCLCVLSPRTHLHTHAHKPHDLLRHKPDDNVIPHYVSFVRRSRNQFGIIKIEQKTHEHVVHGLHVGSGEIYLIESRENSWAMNLLCFFWRFVWIGTWGPPNFHECECGIRTSQNRGLVLLFREMMRFRPKAQDTTTGHSFIRSMLIFHSGGFRTRFKSPGSMLLFLLCSSINGKPLDFLFEWRNHTHLLHSHFHFVIIFRFSSRQYFFIRFHWFLENSNFCIIGDVCGQKVPSFGAKHDSISILSLTRSRFPSSNSAHINSGIRNKCDSLLGRQWNVKHARARLPAWKSEKDAENRLQSETLTPKWQVAISRY